MKSRIAFTPLLVIATDARGALIADALRALPATRVHIVHARVQILYDQTQWGDIPADVARHRVMDAIGFAGIEFLRL